MRRWLVLGITLVLVLVGALALVVSRPSTATPTQPIIVTTFHPLTAFVRPIIGSVAQVEQLVPAGSEVHDYQASPANLVAVRSADLVISNGADLEQAWLDPLRAAAGSTAPQLTLAEALADAVPLLRAEEEYAGGNQVNIDPHLWVSPKNAVLIVQEIRDAIIAVDPAQRATYETNAAAFIAELVTFDTEIEQTVQRFTQREFIAFHNAFAYFARDYGLRQVATIELTPGEAPRPVELQRIRTLVAQYQLRGLFTEPQSSPVLVEQLAADLGIVVRELDPLESAPIGESYIDGMRRNIAALSDVLS